MIKGYLKDFLEAPPDVKKSEKALSAQVPKVTKGAFGTFGTSSQGDIPKVEQPSRTAGTMANPITVHANRAPSSCYMDDCAGKLSMPGERWAGADRLTGRRHLWQCDKCGCWFTLAGPVSEDDVILAEIDAALRALEDELDGEGGRSKWVN